MAGIVRIGNLTVGDGAPKICVSLTGGDMDALREELRAAGPAADLAEWRIDHFAAAGFAEGAARDDGRWDALREAADRLREEAGAMPLLATCRTVRDGGKAAPDAAAYSRLYAALIRGGKVDAVDLELSAGEETLAALTAQARENGVAVIISSHDFAATPSRDEMMARLTAMRRLGADIPKLAVMPGRFADVLALLEATDEFAAASDGPVITMAMGWLGRITRLCGAASGSAVTYGCAGGGREAAPGQLTVQQLRAALDLLQGG